MKPRSPTRPPKPPRLSLEAFDGIAEALGFREAGDLDEGEDTERVERNLQAAIAWRDAYRRWLKEMRR